MTFQEVADSMEQLIGEVTEANFAALPRQTVIGLEQGEDSEIFGMIADAAQTDAGQTVVVDQRMNRVMMYGPEGEYLDQFGRPGRGPTEFNFLRAIDIGPDGVVRVLDEGNLRVSVLDTAGDSLHLVDTQRLPFLAKDFCYMEGLHFFVTARPQGLVEGLDPDGEIVVSFGAPDPLENLPAGSARESSEETMYGGMITCVPRLERVIVASRFTPDVWAFDTRGRLIWHTLLQDYKAMRKVLVDGSSTATTFAFDDPSGTHNTLAGLASLDDEVFVQLASLDWVHREPGDRPIDTRVLSMTTGEELRASSVLPQIGAGHGSHWVAFVNSPFPRAMVVDKQAVHEVTR